MQDLIKQIIEKTGIPADKAEQVLGVVANFVKEKFPMMGGQIDSLLGSGKSSDGAAKDEDEGGLISGIGSKFGL